MSANPTKEEIHEVREILKEPLTDKQVMIPFTTRAFFPGSLQPCSSDNNQQEQVLVRMGNEHLMEMERTEARDYLQRRAESMQGTTAPTSADDEPTIASSRTPSRSPPSISTTPTTTTKPDSRSSPLPYFEIREEYDETGREVRAEAVNVMKELEFLQKQEEAQTTEEKPRTAASTDEGEADLSLGDATDETDRPTPISDKAYAALTSRLDELAELEEDDEKTQKVNQRSSKKLQSKGWAKGFLNKKNVPKTEKQSKANDERKEADSEKQSSSNRKVAFREENDVREIPRVGQKSASELRPVPSLRKPIESDVFSGIIRERSVEDSSASRETSSASSSKPRKKKLSRFAQERQEQIQDRQQY